MPVQTTSSCDPAGGERLVRVFDASSGFHWPNGIALSLDSPRLHIAHLGGTRALDRRTDRITPPAHPPSASTQETDGLYACDDALGPPCSAAPASPA